MKNIIVLGGGAAGFFAAIQAKKINKLNNVNLVERTGKVLQKVLISGGGRCNVTHFQLDNGLLSQNYPRGNKELKQAFHLFSVQDTIQFFETRGVKLKVEQDGRMFPISDDSNSIANCLLEEAESLGVQVHLNSRVESINNIENKFRLQLENGKNLICNSLIIASGGVQSLKSISWMEGINHTIVPPYPSIFTFFVADRSLQELSGVSFEAKIKFKDFKYEWTAPILITHWGLSGPAVLRLSAFAAQHLFLNNYTSQLLVSFFPELNQELMISYLKDFKEKNPKKTLRNSKLTDKIPTRLWEYFLSQLEINPDKIWIEISNKNLNQLAEKLIRWEIEVTGKGKFKEEFVQAGGISLKEIDFKTMESKKHPNLYFAGEILDLDGVTGGFNFQAAWTTGYIAGKNAGS